MAFESSKNSVVEQLCGTVALPKMVRVRQEFDHTHMEPAEIPNAVWAQLERDAVKQNIKPGMTDWGNLKSKVRDALDSYLYAKTGRSPMILPVIEDVGNAL